MQNSAPGPHAYPPRNHNRNLADLPQEAWWTKAFADFEDRQIWSRAWTAVGYESQLPRCGDILPFTIGNHGVYVERGADGDLLARFSFAQHAGCRKVPLQCQTGRKIKCPIVSCGFSRDRPEGFPTSLNRENPRALHFTGKSDARLLKARIETVGEIIFVNIDPAQEISWGAPQITPPAGAAVATLKEYRCNWKLLWREILAGFSPTPAAQAQVVKGQRPGQDGPITLSGVFPNLFMLRKGARCLSVILQPIGMDVTLLRLATWGDAAVEELTGLIADCALRAEEQQFSIARHETEPRPLDNALISVMTTWFAEHLAVLPPPPVSRQIINDISKILETT